MREALRSNVQRQDATEARFGKLVRERIRDIRVAKGIKQADMASRLGLPGQGAYSKMERGQQVISFEALVQIADILGADVASLLRKDPILQGNEVTFGAMTILELSNLWTRQEYAEVVAIAEHSKGAEYFRDIQNLIKLVCWEARAYCRLEQFEKAVDISLPMLDMADQIADKYWIAFTCYNLSVAYDWLGQPDLSYQMIMNAREQFDAKIGDSTKLYQYILFNLGKGQADRHKFTEARVNLNKALSLSKAGVTERIQLHATIAFCLSFIQLQLNDYEAGLSSAWEARNYYQVINNIRGVMETGNNIAVLLDKLGREEEADCMWQEVYEIAKAHPELVRPIARESLIDEGFDL